MGTPEMPGPSNGFHWQWFHNLIASPLLLLWFKRVRRFIVFWEKEEEKEDAESSKVLQSLIPSNLITREEFEPRMQGLKDDMNLMHKDLSDKLMAHAAQARQDMRDLKAEQRQRDVEMFQKIDGFMTQVVLNQRSKED